jgi:3-oxoadipate enol-lactonase
MEHLGMQSATDLTIPHDGVDFRCRLDGREGAPWLVCSNSLLTDITLWDAQVEALGDRFRILRYDQRGHGGSGLGGEAVNFRLLVADARALCAHFGVRDAVFMGVSMGAATAFGLAAAAPEIVARIVASDGQAKTAPGGRETWQQRIDLARAKGMEAVVEATLGRWFGPDFLDPAHPDRPRALTMMRGTPLEGYVACATALQDYDFSGGLATTRQPTLLIAGERDGAMPATMRAIQARMPDARYVEIPDAGHLPNLERPEAFNAAVEAFLDGR